MVGQLAARRAAGIVLEMVKVRGVGREGGREGRKVCLVCRTARSQEEQL